MATFKAKPIRLPKRELSRCVLALQELLVGYDSGTLFLCWLALPPRKKAAFRTAMAKVIQQHLLTDAFWTALKADTIASDGTVQVNSHLYQYFRKVLFRGDGRKFLLFLAGIKEQ